MYVYIFQGTVVKAQQAVDVHRHAQTPGGGEAGPEANTVPATAVAGVAIRAPNTGKEEPSSRPRALGDDEVAAAVELRRKEEMTALSQSLQTIAMHLVRMLLLHCCCAKCSGRAGGRGEGNNRAVWRSRFCSSTIERGNFFEI